VLAQKDGAQTSAFIDVLTPYLPQQAEQAEILAWIKENIDFSGMKSKMQPMGPIMKHFGSRADGNAVREILQKL
jgi:uncharacterized protein YqeY